MTRRFGESESKYLKGSDLLHKNGRTYHEVMVTIDCVTEEQVGEEKDDKFVLYFVGKSKGMALNVTNETILMDLFGHPDGGTPEAVTAHFAGKAVVIYFDPTVTYGGKRVGGLRLKAATAPAAQAPAPAAPPAEEPPPPADADQGAPEMGDDDIPF